MVKNEIILQGRNLDKLIFEAEAKLNSNRDNMEIEIIEENKTLLGVNYKIKATLKEKSRLEKLEEIIGSIQDDWESSVSSDYSGEGKTADIKSYEHDVLNNHLENDEDIEKELIDCIYEISVTQDSMEAHLTVIPPKGGRGVNLDDIFEQLKIKNIKFGVLEEEIKSIANNKIYNNSILIAKGKPPINGEDAILKYHFDTSNERKVCISDDGKVDFRELSLIKNVNENQILVTMIPSTKGVNGQNVYGEDVQAKDGKKVNLPRGKNVAITEDGLSLISTIKGEVKLVDNKVSVFPVYEVNSNVDNTTGNIKFVGKVIVKGNVLTGFVIEADEDVEIYGVVEGAQIYSKGNIILHRGIQGMNRGELRCDGDLIAKFIENSRVHAKGNIQTEAIMHSMIYCGKKLEVKGKKGLLVGGEIRASEEIKAKVIGSPMATVTDIEVGTNPEMRSKYESLKMEMRNSTENLLKLTQAVDLLTKIGRSTELTEEKKALLNKSIVMKLQMQNKIEQLKSEISYLESYIEEISNGKIKVEGLVYPGTKVTIGSNSMYIKDQIQYVTFYRYGGEIKIGSFER